MKEIDFLPKWYKSGRKQELGYRTQYVALGGLFVIMVVWSFISAHTVSKIEAETAYLATNQATSDNVLQEFASIKNELTQLQKKVTLINKVDSKINVADVLAELSFLISEKIVISKVEFTAEQIKSEKDQKSRGIRNAKKGVKLVQLLGDVRFKIMISGVAPDAGEVAKLICKLEDSPYFSLVYPSFSRNAPLKNGTKITKALAAKNKSGSAAGEISPVSEFEIVCYLANYKQDEASFAKETVKNK